MAELLLRVTVNADKVWLILIGASDCDLGEPTLHRRSLMDSGQAIWPNLTYTTWRETAVTLQLWSLIVG